MPIIGNEKNQLEFMLKALVNDQSTFVADVKEGNDLYVVGRQWDRLQNLTQIVQDVWLEYLKCKKPSYKIFII
jgi:hypothetical protein